MDLGSSSEFELGAGVADEAGPSHTFPYLSHTISRLHALLRPRCRRLSNQAPRIGIKRAKKGGTGREWQKGERAKAPKIESRYIVLRKKKSAKSFSSLLLLLYLRGPLLPYAETTWCSLRWYYGGIAVPHRYRHALQRDACSWLLLQNSYKSNRTTEQKPTVGEDSRRHYERRRRNALHEVPLTGPQPSVQAMFWPERPGDRPDPLPLPLGVAHTVSWPRDAERISGRVQSPSQYIVQQGSARQGGCQRRCGVDGRCCAGRHRHQGRVIGQRRIDFGSVATRRCALDSAAGRLWAMTC